MKKIHKVFCTAVMIALLCASTLITPALAFYSEGPSDWAREEVRAAIDSGIPDWETESRRWDPSWTGLSFENEYPKPISRVNFCHLIARVVAIDKNLSSSRLSGSVYPSPFSDLTRVTWNYDALLVNSLGIIEGASEDKFNPFGTLTREQAAMALAKTIITIRPSLWQDGTDYMAGKAITDKDEISPEAYNYVGFLYDQGVIRGMGDGRFAPKEPLTTEQAMVTCYRLCKQLNVPGVIPIEQASIWLDKHHMNREYEFLSRLQYTGNPNDGYFSVYYGGRAEGITSISVDRLTVDGVGELGPATQDYVPENGYPLEEYMAEVHLVARNMTVETFYTAHVDLTLTLEDGEIQHITDTFVFLY